MVDAHDQRAAALVAIDQVDLPERVRQVQSSGGELAGTRLQRRTFALAALAHQLFAHDVAFDVELVVAHPVGEDCLLDDLLAKPGVGEQARFDALAQCREVERRAQQPDADDHHEVDGAVHPQPGRIDTRHPLGTLGHFGTPGSTRTTAHARIGANPDPHWTLRPYSAD